MALNWFQIALRGSETAYYSSLNIGSASKFPTSVGHDGVNLVRWCEFLSEEHNPTTGR